MVFLCIFIAHFIIVKLLWIIIQRYCKTLEKRWHKAFVYLYILLTPYKLLK